MTEPLLAAWESFYVIVGSAAAALTGLQFVVITLVADRGIASDDVTTGFSTPTVVHLGSVLLMSGILSAPWHGTGWPVALVAACGVCGCAYMMLVVRAARRQRDYELVAEDVIWHWCLPSTAYAALVVCGLFRRDAEEVLFAVAASALLLLFIGIHNAWDAAVFTSKRRREPAAPRKPASRA